MVVVADVEETKDELALGIQESNHSDFRELVRAWTAPLDVRTCVSTLDLLDSFESGHFCILVTILEPREPVGMTVENPISGPMCQHSLRCNIVARVQARCRRCTMHLSVWGYYAQVTQPVSTSPRYVRLTPPEQAKVPGYQFKQGRTALLYFWICRQRLLHQTLDFSHH
jgi:hypothetical protein